MMKSVGLLGGAWLLGLQWLTTTTVKGSCNYVAFDTVAAAYATNVCARDASASSYMYQCMGDQMVEYRWTTNDCTGDYSQSNFSSNGTTWVCYEDKSGYDCDLSRLIYYDGCAGSEVAYEAFVVNSVCAELNDPSDSYATYTHSCQDDTIRTTMYADEMCDGAQTVREFSSGCDGTERLETACVASSMATTTGVDTWTTDTWSTEPWSTDTWTTDTDTWTTDTWTTDTDVMEPNTSQINPGAPAECEYALLSIFPAPTEVCLTVATTSIPSSLMFHCTEKDKMQGLAWLNEDQCAGSADDIDENPAEIWSCNAPKTGAQCDITTMRLYDDCEIATEGVFTELAVINNMCVPWTDEETPGQSVIYGCKDNVLSVRVYYADDCTGAASFISSLASRCITGSPKFEVFCGTEAPATTTTKTDASFGTFHHVSFIVFISSILLVLISV